jgi:hypothetical protein
VAFPGIKTKQNDMLRKMPERRTIIVDQFSINIFVSFVNLFFFFYIKNINDAMMASVSA